MKHDNVASDFNKRILEPPAIVKIELEVLVLSDRKEIIHKLCCDTFSGEWHPAFKQAIQEALFGKITE